MEKPLPDGRAAIAFGRPLPLRLSGGALPTDRLFTGQTRDLGNDAFYFFKSRYYDATIGQFQAPDLALPKYDPSPGNRRPPEGPANPQVLNRYAYALNNPLRIVDPTGSAAEDPGAGSTTITVFIPGVGGYNAGYDQFVSDLNATFGNVWVIPAYGQGYAADLRLAQRLGSQQTAWARNAGYPTGDPYAAPAAAFIQSLIKASGNPRATINIIGDSGGSSVAMDTAALLGAQGVHVANVITIGNYVAGPKPFNVGKWTAIAGSADPIALGSLGEGGWQALGFAAGGSSTSPGPNRVFWLPVSHVDFSVLNTPVISGYLSPTGEGLNAGQNYEQAVLMDIRDTLWGQR